MKIMVINPNSSREMTASIRSVLENIKRPDTELTVTCPENGPIEISSAYDETLAAYHMIEVGMLAGCDAKKSDVLGLAIRGGSVVSHIRWGDHVDAPVIMRGKVDYLLAFEPLEALRQVEFLHSRSTIVFNEYKIPPVTVSSGLTAYPEDGTLEEALKASAGLVYSFNTTEKALELGNVKTVNVMLLGALSAFLDVDTTIWEKAVRKFVPQKVAEINLKAFYTGLELMEEKK